jgi:7-carboxy-7-deazaguanine synthase
VSPEQQRHNHQEAATGMQPGSERLRITEIFYSLQGESLSAGCPTGFVRLTGCPLRCGYCDTAYAFHGGEWMTLDAILERVAGYGARYVTVTGGEPLAQKPCLQLLCMLCDAGYRVSLETSGALDIAAVDPRVVRVMDLKTPGSGEVERNRWTNIEQLRRADQVKFVICNRGDYEWAGDCLREYDLTARCEILFSPAWEQQNATELAEWILQDRLPVRLQLQMHKYLWGNVPGH